MKVYDKASGKKIHYKLKRIEEIERVPDSRQILYSVKFTFQEIFSFDQLKFLLYFTLTVLLGGIGIHKLVIKRIGSAIMMILLLVVGITLYYINLSGFLGTLIDISAYTLLGIWALWYLIDILSLFSEETEQIDKESTSFSSGIILFSLAILFYQWVFINYSEIPYINNTVKSVDTFFKETLPQQTREPIDSLKESVK